MVEILEETAKLFCEGAGDISIMNMNRVNEIIRKHNELLDSMTEKERMDYYAEVDLVVECETMTD